MQVLAAAAKVADRDENTDRVTFTVLTFGAVVNPGRTHHEPRNPETNARATRRLRPVAACLFVVAAMTAPPGPGTPVYVPLPPVVMGALGRLPKNKGGRYFSTKDAKPGRARTGPGILIRSVR